MKHSVQYNSELISQSQPLNSRLLEQKAQASRHPPRGEFFFVSFFIPEPTSGYKWSGELSRQMCDVEIHIVQHFSMTECFFFLRILLFSLLSFQQI